MKPSILIALAFTCCLFSCSEPAPIPKPSSFDYPQIEQYIRQSASDWAEAIATGDTATVSRIMADDFVGISSRGELYDKEYMLQLTLEAPHRFRTEVFDVNVRFFDDCAVAQGYETWTRLADSTSTTSIWTDTWVCRNGNWQIVAAQDYRFEQ